jgi:hypothetical protein
VHGGEESECKQVLIIERGCAPFHEKKQIPGYENE